MYLLFSIHKCARINYETPSLICASYRRLEDHYRIIKRGLCLVSRQNRKCKRDLFFLGGFSLSSSSSSSFILLLFYHVLENASINRIGRSFPSPPIYYTRAFGKCVYKQNLRDILGGRNLLSLLPLPFLFPATFITRV